MLLSGLSHRRQEAEADCLVACVAMVLEYLAVPVQYPRLRRMLGTTEAGTPFHHVDRLREQGFFVERGQGDTETLWSHLTTGLPVIVAVRTDDLPYWLNRTDIPDEEKATDHAVVVVGLDEQRVYANDPDFEQAPQVIDLDEFLLAWVERDYEYVVIGLEDFAEVA
jgi:ABC-type bacteriocin/lantibiotic exporter with double-glycine peptidase domain